MTEPLNLNTKDEELRSRLQAVWRNLPGWGALAAVNHTSIGMRFMVTGVFFFLFGGLLAMLMRTQLALPDQELIEANTYNQLFTMHGTVMMFLFAIPVLEGLAMYLIPKMIGARDLAYPRVSAFGYYCYLFGGLIIISSVFLDMAPAAGWFMYTPLSGAVFSPDKGPDFWLLGITFVEISAISAGVELVVSILRTRTRGMSLWNMPIFCWYILAMGLMIIFGFPPLILASILLELERSIGFIFFSVEGGGDPLLWLHLFWMFGHPEVYILFLPAAGIVSTLIPVFARRPLIGYRWIVLSIILMGFISFGLWVHHMFTVGIPQLAQAFFSIASMMVAVPTAIQLFAWLATLWCGRVVFRLPMLWIFGFLVIFILGGLTGVMLALVPFNWQVHDTHFVVAHMHYVLVGGMLFPLIAGFYYWLPHFSGRMPSERFGKWGFWLTFSGFNITFLLMHLTGLLGMPRRVYSYETGLGWDWLNLLSSIGGFIMAIGIAVVILDFVLHFRFGQRVYSNPWGADTLEWATRIPVSPYNFVSLPTVETRHPLWQDPDLQCTIDAGEHGLNWLKAPLRETYGSHAITGKLQEIIHLPTNSWVPLQAALVMAVVCLSLLVRVYPLALVAAVVSLVLILRWTWFNGAHPKAAPLSEHEIPELPLHSRTFDGPGRWGMVISMMANGTLYASLVFAWFYLWTVAADFQLPDTTPVSRGGLLLAAALLSIAALIYRQAVRGLRRGEDQHLAAWLWGAAALALLHVFVLVWIMLQAGLQPQALAHDAVLSVMLWYLLIHSALVVILTIMQALRVHIGYVSLKLPYEPMVLQPFWHYTLGVFWLSLAAFILIPMSWGGI